MGRHKIIIKYIPTRFSKLIPLPVKTLLPYLPSPRKSPFMSFIPVDRILALKYPLENNREYPSFIKLFGTYVELITEPIRVDKTVNFIQDITLAVIISFNNLLL